MLVIGWVAEISARVERGERDGMVETTSFIVAMTMIADVGL